MTLLISILLIHAVIWIFVYNAVKNPMSTSERGRLSEEKSSLEYICNQITKLADGKFVRFGVERLRVMYFKDVYTFTNQEFEEFLKNG